MSPHFSIIPSNLLVKDVISRIRGCQLVQRVILLDIAYTTSEGNQTDLNFIEPLFPA